MKILQKISYLKELPVDQRCVIVVRRMEKNKLFLFCGSICSCMQGGKTTKIMKINVWNLSSYLVSLTSVGRDWTISFSLAHCQNKTHCRCVQVFFQFVWSSVYGYQHCNFLVIHLQREQTLDKKYCKGHQKSSCLRGVLKQRSLECVLGISQVRNYSKVLGFDMLEKWSRVPSSVPSCLFTAYWYYFFFFSLSCWDLAKSPLFILLSHSLSNTFS